MEINKVKRKKHFEELFLLDFFISCTACSSQGFVNNGCRLK